MSNYSVSELGLIVAAARGLIRSSPVAALATVEIETSCPYASLITVATETDGSPIILISKLAWHTRNLEADPRASPRQPRAKMAAGGSRLAIRTAVN